jgi:hypothetical protein
MVFQESQLAPLFRARDAVGTLALKLGQFLAGLWPFGTRVPEADWDLPPSRRRPNGPSVLLLQWSRSRRQKSYFASGGFSQNLVAAVRERSHE